MSHAGLALAIVAFGAGIGAWRVDGRRLGTVRLAFGLALVALAFHAVELLIP